MLQYHLLHRDAAASLLTAESKLSEVLHFGALTLLELASLAGPLTPVRFALMRTQSL